MLRDIRCPFVKPRLTAVKYTTASNVVTISTGVGAVTGTSAAAGNAVLSVTRGYARKPICVANASSLDVAAGGFVAGTNNLYPTAIGHTLKTVNSAASGDDGTCHAVFLGFDYRDATRYSRRTNAVRGDFDQSKVVAFRCNTASSGSVTINARNVSVNTRTGTGDITLNFRTAFASAPVVIATAVLATGQIVMVDTVTASSVRLKAFTNGGSTPADAIINVIVVGDTQGPGERCACVPAVTDQRKPVMFGYSVVYAASVPGYDFNSGDATLTDTAIGRTTFTFREKFAREAIVCAMPITNTGVQCCTIDTSSATAFEVKQFSSANSLARCTDTSGFQVIGIGFDDSSEY